MKKYKYDERWPWDIIFKCEPSNSTISLTNCNARLKYRSCTKQKCFYRMAAIKQRFKDMTTKDHMGIMFGCLTCRYCVFFHKAPREIDNLHFVCKKWTPVSVMNLDSYKCQHFLLKKYIRCPHRDEVIDCNTCLWDYHTDQAHCKNCEVFDCQPKKKPKLQLRKSKLKLKLRKKK